MSQSEYESLEEYLETFLYNVQKTKQTNLPLDVIHTIFLKGILDENLDALNLMGARDISHFPFPKIVELGKKYSRGKAKRCQGQRDIVTKETKSISNGVTKSELGHLLEDFKTNLMNSLGSQIDTLKSKKKQDEQDQVLSMFCAKCRKKHALKDYPLDNIQICGLSTDNHATDDCPKLKELQTTHME